MFSYNKYIGQLKKLSGEKKTSFILGLVTLSLLSIFKLTTKLKNTYFVKEYLSFFFRTKFNLSFQAFGK